MTNLCLDVLPLVPKEIVTAIGDIAELTALIRTTVPFGVGDPSSNLEVEIEAEYSTRLSKQLLKLAIMLAVVRQKSAVGFEELETIMRVGLDTLPPKRFKILRELYWSEKPLSKAELVEAIGFDRWTIMDSMKNLEYIGLVKGRAETIEKGIVDFYEASDRIKKQLFALFDMKTDRKGVKSLELKNPLPPCDSIRTIPIPVIKTLSITNGSTKAQDYPVIPEFRGGSMISGIRAENPNYTVGAPDGSLVPVFGGSYWPKVCVRCHFEAGTPDELMRHVEVCGGSFIPKVGG